MLYQSTTIGLKDFPQERGFAGNLQLGVAGGTVTDSLQEQAFCAIRQRFS
jgi:hypothetical protein